MTTTSVNSLNCQQSAETCNLISLVVSDGGGKNAMPAVIIILCSALLDNVITKTRRSPQDSCRDAEN